MTYGSIAVTGCALDLATKEWVFRWRGMPRADNEWWIWEGYVGIETALNTGALFGLGAGNAHWFAVLSVLAFLGILAWLFWAGAARDPWLTIALGGVTGGIFGNLYDRLGLWHYEGVDASVRNAVRDWILLRYGDFTWPNFNIADCLLVVGAGMLVLHAFWHHQPDSKPADA
ncbi:MAG: signal peptidase II [Pirellulaceae bacterium]|nr:signal peptidase II [Pirellulaceae bacterium]